jgi:hypothetical protein
MTYSFSASEFAAIEAAYEAATLDNTKWGDVYETILDTITDSSGDPKVGVDPSAWLWIRGAMQINRGEGDFSTFIREYSKARYVTRFGSVPTPAQIQNASNEVAQNVADTILSGDGTMLSLAVIGNKDAEGSIVQVLGHVVRNRLDEGNSVYLLKAPLGRAG